jgi:hypothetical protein
MKKIIVICFLFLPFLCSCGISERQQERCENSFVLQKEIVTTPADPSCDMMMTAKDNYYCVASSGTIEEYQILIGENQYSPNGYYIHVTQLAYENISVGDEVPEELCEFSFWSH